MFFSSYRVASGTRGPIINDSGGVSKMEEHLIVSVSPIRTTDELATPVIRMSPMRISLFSTVIFMGISSLFFIDKMLFNGKLDVSFHLMNYGFIICVIALIMFRFF